MLIQLLFPIYVSIKIKREKRRLANEENVQARENLNTVKYNRDPMSDSLTTLAGLLISACLLIDIEANNVEAIQSESMRLVLYLSADMFFSFLIVFLPTCIYVANPDLRKHLVGIFFAQK